MISKTKRLLALLCAVVMVTTTFFGNWYTKQAEAEDSSTAEATSTDPTPVELYGFQNVTISDFTHADESAMPEGYYDGDPLGARNEYNVKDLANFNNVLLSMKVKFDAGTYTNALFVGSAGGWRTLTLHPNQNGTTLEFAQEHANPKVTNSTLPSMEVSKTSLSNFIGKEFLLQMSFEYGDFDGDSAEDLRLGVYIEGELYNDELFIISGYATDCKGSYLGLYRQIDGKGITLHSVQFSMKPVKIEGFKNITISDFKDSTGAQMPTGTYSHGVGHNLFGWDGADDFNQVIFSMKVKFGPVDKGYNNALHFGGPRDDWNVMCLYPTSADCLQIDDPHAPALTTGSMDPIVMNAQDAGISSFVDNEFCLELSFEYFDADSDGGTDLKLGVYIDGKLYGDQSFTIKDINPEHKGTWLRWYSESASNVITLNDFKTIAEPIRLSGFDTITVSDFKDASGAEMESKGYAYDATVPDTTFTLKKTGDNFANKLFSMKVKFGYKISGVNNYDTRMVIGADNVYGGIFVYVNSDDQLCIDNKPTDNSGRITTEQAGVSSFLNTPFILQMSFADISDGLVVGVFINGALCKTFEWSGVATSQYNNQIHLRRNLEDSFIIVNSIYEDEFPKDPGIQPDPTFTKLTFGHFGITNNTYPCKPGDLAIYGQASQKTDLDQTVISGDVFLEGGNSTIIWGGIGGWNGLRMGASTDTMSLTWIDSGDNAVWSTAALTSNVADVKFVGEKYNLKLSAEIIAADADGVANDIRIGIWFNDVLYNQEFFVASNIGTSTYFGNYFGVYCPNEGDQVTFGSEMDLLEQPNASLQKVTFFQYGVKDGTYEGASDLNVKGSYINDTTVAGTVLCGEVQLHNASAGTINIFLGASENAWYGVRLTKYNHSENMELIYQLSDTDVRTPKIFESSKAGVDFTKDKFDLMWSMELVDSDGDGESDDLKMGVWFDGFLYQNQYIYITDYAFEVGAGFGTYCAPGTSITLCSIYELTKLPDKSFDRITFSDFGLETQEVTCDGGIAAKGTAKGYSVLDKVVFSGDFRFAEDASYQVIYASNGGWDGLRVLVDASSINVSWFKNVDGADQSQMVVWANAEYAKLTSITKSTFNLKISTELVDADGNGDKNDIKVGVWFNDILYNFEGTDYHIVKDWGDQLKNGFGIYSPSGNKVMIRNDATYQSNPYYYEDISSYRGATKSAPETPIGYVFSGWYADPEYKEYIGTDVTSGNAWAKFVEDDVLSVKSQVKVTTTDANGDGKLDVTSNSTDLRVATTVDGLEYRRISFYLQKQKDGIYGTKFDTATVSDENARMVYEKLYALEDKTTVTEHKPTIFTWQSDYFKTFTITDIPSSDYATKIKVTPYWITMDGTLVEGKVVETCVDDYTNNKSKAVSVGYIGDDTMPITGYNGPYVVSNTNDTMLYPDYITDAYFKMIADSGVNVIMSNNLDYKHYPLQVKKALQLGEKYGVGIYVQDSTILDMTSKSDVEAQIANYKEYESFVGMYLVDEPGTDTFNGNDRNVAKYQTIAGILDELEVLTYVNLFPVVNADDRSFWDKITGQEDILSDNEKNVYSAYVSEVNSTLKPAVLMWDYYPFAVEPNEDGTRADQVTTTHPEYFWNMGEIRRQAQADNKPFWAYVQAGANWNDNGDYFNTKVYAPTEGQFKWNMNTALAFGAQGIQYFPLIQPYHFAYGTDATHWDFERNGLIGAFGNPTQWYDYAQAANAHVGAMDHILMNSYNEKIIAIGSAVSDTSEANGVVTTVSYNELAGATGNALIGCFNYQGKTALYVVNYDYDNAGTVTLKFSSDKSITKIENAETTKLTTSNKQLALSMEAGEGILLVIE